LNKPKRSLRSTLQELTATLVAGILAAARESLLELAAASPSQPTRRQRRRAARPRTVVRPTSEVEHATAAAADVAGGLAITDPMALLAALATADAVAWNEPAPHEGEPVQNGARSEEPEILRAMSPVVPAPESAPALREGEVIVRRSAGGVVLRRRRA
jgi:hypothetical protein